MPSYHFRQSQHHVNLWRIPLQMSLGALVLFALTMVPDMLAAYHVLHLPDWFSMGGIDDARAILGAMLGCVSTVLALIFSVSLLVLSMVANLFGPRLLYRFVQDWVTQATIGLFMAAFIYVFLVFLVTHSDTHTTFIPQVSLITSWFLVLAAFSFLVFYSHRIAISIQNPDAVARIVDDLRRAVAVTSERKNRFRSTAPQSPATATSGDEGFLVRSVAGGYLQEINQEALLRGAVGADAAIQVLFRPGQFVLMGEPIARVLSSSGPDRLTRLIQQNIIIGRHRILTQDLEFGIAQVVEIAIRALSPAINDTFTGVACVDLLGEALIILAEGAPDDGRWSAADGQIRLTIQPLRTSRLVKQGFDQIRQAAADNPAVLIRQLTILGRLATRLTLPEDRAALREQAQAVWETAAREDAVRMDRDDIDAAWSKTRALLE